MRGGRGRREIGWIGTRARSRSSPSRPYSCQNVAAFARVTVARNRDRRTLLASSMPPHPFPFHPLSKRDATRHFRDCILRARVCIDVHSATSMVTSMHDDGRASCASSERLALKQSTDDRCRMRWTILWSRKMSRLIFNRRHGVGENSFRSPFKGKSP